MDVAGQGVAVDRPRRQVRDQGGGGRREAVAALPQIVGVGRVDRVAREPQPAFDAAQQLAARQGEAVRRGQRVHQGEQRCQIPRLGGAHGVRQPVPEGHGVPLDQPRRGLGGPYGGDARGGQPAGDGHLALGPLP